MEESRCKHKIQSLHTAGQQIARDCLISPSPHGSPYHVHPYPSPVRLQHAFQPPPNNSPNMFYPKGLKPQQFDNRAHGTPHASPILGRALCLTSKDSPIPGRVSHLSDRFESLSLHSDTDSMVAKIGAMFPTVSNTHIRILLKKYFNREAVVISALQVEKHPLVMPGPLTMSPSAARLSKGAAGKYSAMAVAKGQSTASTQEYYLPFTTTPHSSPSLFRPPSGTSSYYGTTHKTSDGHVTRQHSPKMKLKYLKSIFPKADEMMILEFLNNNDNNVQKVSEELIKRGFVKKENNLIKKEKPLPPPPMPTQKKTEPVVRTAQDKKRLMAKFRKLYPLFPDHVITIALESVEYSESLTEQVLNSVVVDVEVPRRRISVPKEIKRVTLVEPKKGSGYDVSPRLPSPPPPVRRPKPWAQPLKPILKNSTSIEPKYRSNYNAPRRGPNPQLRRGPQDALLLEAYLPWTGPDPEQRSGASARSEGPAPRSRSLSHARGSSGSAKGPQGLAKGSTYYKNSKKSAKIVP